MKSSMELLAIYIHSLSSCIIHLLDLIGAERRSLLVHSVSLSLIKIRVFLGGDGPLTLRSQSYLVVVRRLQLGIWQIISN